MNSYIQDYIWDFIQDHLPDPVYNAVYAFFEHLTSVYYGLNGAFTWMFRNGGEEDAGMSISQQILPPILSIIAIYFGILSLYRTTTSVIRTSFALVKWASIIAALAMAAGWFIGRGPLDVGMLLRVANELTNGQDRVNTRTGGATRPATPRSYGGRTQTRRGRRNSDAERPGIFDSFLKHQQWREGQAQTEQVQEYVEQVVKKSQKIVKEGSGLFNMLFGSPQVEQEDEAEEGPGRRTRSQRRKSRY